MKKYCSAILLILIVILAIFLRFYQLGSVPSGLTNDEANFGYDAYSILKTGNDQWGNFLPISGFKGFGSYNPVFYIYLLIPSIFVFGLTPVGVRFPSAFFGVLSVITIYFLAKKLFGEKIGLVSAFLLAISPWAMGLSRVGIDSNVAMFFLLLGLTLLTCVKKSKYYLFTGIVCFVLSIYTYTAYTLFIPLLLVCLAIYCRKYISENKINIFFCGILLVFLLLPLILARNTGAAKRATQVGFQSNTESKGIVNDINDMRGDCLRTFNNQLFCKLIANKPLSFTSTVIKNYLNQFSIGFLYLYGTPTQLSILPERGLEFTIEMLLLFSGLFFLLTKKTKVGIALILLLLLSAIPASLTGKGHYSRSSLMLPFLLSIEAIGLMSFNKRKILFGFFSVVLFISVINFSINYFTYFKINYSARYAYNELAKDIAKEKNNYESIYVSGYLVDSEQHIFYLFYTQYDPKIYQQKKNIIYEEKQDGSIAIKKIDTIYFANTLPNLPRSNILLIGSPLLFPAEVPIKKEIKNLRGDAIFYEVELQTLNNFKKEKAHSL